MRQLSTQQRQLRSPYYTQLLPDWDVNQVIPMPVESFQERLKIDESRSEFQPRMKPVNEMWKILFKDTFKGLYEEN